MLAFIAGIPQRHKTERQRCISTLAVNRAHDWSLPAPNVDSLLMTSPIPSCEHTTCASAESHLSEKWFPKIICGRFPLCLHIHSLLILIDSFYSIHEELEVEELELELQSWHYALKFMYIPFVGTIHTTVCILDIYISMVPLKLC